jgi:periplasmic protein TonB
MATSAPARALRRIGPNDRLGLTMILAGIVHAIVVLGVSFKAEPAQSFDASTMDVILVQTRSEKAPEKADFLAQAQQEGGGDSEKALRPSDVFSSTVPKLEEGIAPTPIEASAPKPETRSQATPEVLVQQQSEQRVAQQIERQEQLDQAQKRSAEDIERDLEMARLNAEINRTQQAYAKRPKRKFISANTQEFEFASYMQSWVARVERVGNINYPEQARAENMHGSLVLSVAIRRNGSIEDIEVIQSSGKRMLDEAAIRIVEQAGPYAALPDSKERVDVLHITRTWQFLPGNVLSSE